jgi:hypothetical protein
MVLRNQLGVALYLVLAFRWDIKGICSRAHLLSIRVRDTARCCVSAKVGGRLCPKKR